MSESSTGLLAGRIALITGASRGIGAAVAKAYAAAGAHVIVVARTQSGLEAVDDEIRAAGGQATLLPLDLREYDKIDQMAFAIAQRFGRLDILVANAGVLGGLYPVGHMPPKMFEQVMATNFTVNWRLLRACDALLRVSEAGRVIVTTSSVASGTQPYWGPYAASKAALEALVRSYAGEVEKTPIRVNMVDPGAVRTGLRATAFPGEDASRLPAPEQIAPMYLDLASAACRQHGQIIRRF